MTNAPKLGRYGSIQPIFFEDLSKGVRGAGGGSRRICRPGGQSPNLDRHNLRRIMRSARVCAAKNIKADRPRLWSDLRPGAVSVGRSYRAAHHPASF